MIMQASLLHLETESGKILNEIILFLCGLITECMGFGALLAEGCLRFEHSLGGQNV